MSGGPSLLGAEGARELIAVLTGARASAEIRRKPDARHTAVRALRVRRADEPGPTVLRRHVLELMPHPAREVRARVPWDAPGTAILTNNREVAATAPGAIVLVPEPDGDLDSAVTQALSPARPRHLRVLADLTEVEPGGRGWEEVLRLHDACFLAARAGTGWLGSGDTIAFSLLGGIDAAGVPHPAAGLFTGLTKALAHELPEVDVFAVTDQARDAPTAIRGLEAESAHARVFPVVYRAGGQRLVMAVRPADAVPGPFRLGRDSVVVAAGGGRGIGAAMLMEIARTYRPRIFVLGSNPVDPAALPRDAAALAARKVEFLRERTTGPGRVPVRLAKAEFQRLVQAQETIATLAELRRHCGADRVGYLVCDVRDPGDVSATIADIQDAAGEVDLLLNIAGTLRSAALAMKSPEAFTAVRDLKVRSYVNLKKAFAGRPPRRWFNCGSVSGTFGIRGETDYSAANDFLYTAAEHAVAQGADEFTVGWGLWGEVGMGAQPQLRSLLQSNGDLTPMTTAEGVAHFAVELTQARPPMTSFFGDREYELMAGTGYLDVDRWAGTTPDQGFYVDGVSLGEPGSVSVSRTLDLERDGYLRGHQVDGVPTVPGFFVPELAAGAARLLAPDRVPVAFENLVFTSFLRVRERNRGQAVKVQATVVAADEFETTVEVRVLTDVLAPNGRLLVAGKEHFRTTVRLRDTPLPAPGWSPWPEIGEERLTDPYCRDNPLVRLTGPFVCTEDTRAHPLGARARFGLDSGQLARSRPWLSRFTVPALLFDGMVRLLAIQRDSAGWTPLFVPRSVRRVEVFGAPTDLSLAHGGGVELYTTPAAATLEANGSNQALAVGDDGRVVARVQDVTGVIRGYLHQESGRFADRAEFEARTR